MLRNKTIRASPEAYIQIKYDILKGECIITDLADLELLNLLYPEVYELLRKEHKRFLISQHGVYHLWDESYRNEYSKYSDIFNRPKNIKDDPIVNEMQDRDKEKLDILFKNLFPGLYRQEPKAISNPNYTERYFYQILQSSELSEKDYNELISGPFENIKKFIIEDKEERFSQSLRVKCYEDNTKDKNRAATILHLIFYAAKVYKHFSFAPQDIDRHLDAATSSTEGKKEFLNTLVHENGFSLFVLYMFTFNNFYNARYYWSEFLSDSEMNVYLVDMFKFAIKEKFGFSDILHIYYRTLRTEREEDPTGKITEKEVAIGEISDILRRYIVEHLTECLPSLVYQNHYETNGKFKILNVVSDLWGDWNGLYKYSADNKIPVQMNDAVNEFRDFWNKYEENQRTPLNYDFLHIEMLR